MRLISWANVYTGIIQTKILLHISHALTWGMIRKYRPSMQVVPGSNPGGIWWLLASLHLTFLTVKYNYSLPSNHACSTVFFLLLQEHNVISCHCTVLTFMPLATALKLFLLPSLPALVSVVVAGCLTLDLAPDFSATLATAPSWTTGAALMIGGRPTCSAAACSFSLNSSACSLLAEWHRNK